MSRNTRFIIPKEELFYWDESEGLYKPIIDSDGIVPVKLKEAYDIPSDSIKSKITNLVEIRQPDAFQSSQVLYDYTGRSATPTAITLTPPKGAKGFICELNIQSANASLVAGEGVRINVQGTAHPQIAINALTVFTDYERRAFYRQAVIWYPNASNGSLKSAVDSGFMNYFVPMPLPKQLTFKMEVKPAVANGGGVVAGMTVGWLT